MLRSPSFSLCRSPEMKDVTGLIIGAAGLLVCNRRDTDIVSAQIILIAALYTACVAASGIVCSVLAVRLSPLELLQAKE